MKYLLILIVLLSCESEKHTEITPKVSDSLQINRKKFNYTIDKQLFALYSDTLILVFNKNDTLKFENEYDESDSNRYWVFGYEYKGFWADENYHVLVESDNEGVSNYLLVNYNTGKKYMFASDPIFSPSGEYFVSYTEHGPGISNDVISTWVMFNDSMHILWYTDANDWIPDSVFWRNDSTLSYTKNFFNYSDFDIIDRRIKNEVIINRKTLEINEKEI